MCGGWSSSSVCTGPTRRSAPSIAPASLFLPTLIVALLEASLLFSDLTDGAFDPTVQPLWQLYADHFSSERPVGGGPSSQKLAEALAKVGRSGLLVNEDRVALVKRGAAITLNGIAQGYATDRVVERLRRAGLSTTLVNMGAIRAIGGRPEGTPAFSFDRLDAAT